MHSKSIGPQTEWRHHASQNRRGKLQFDRNASPKALKQEYSTARLENEIKKMLLQPPRAPAAIPRLRSIREVLWDSGRIREANLAHLFAQLSAKQGFHDDVFSILEELHDAGVTLLPLQYENIVEQLGEAFAWKPLLDLVELVHSKISRTTSRILKLRISALVGLGDYRSLDGILAEFGEWNIKPDRETYERLIAGWMHVSNIEKVQSLIDLMKSSGYHITANTWKALVAGYTSRNTSTVEERVLTILRGLSVTGGCEQVHKVLTDCLVRHDISGANFILNLFEPSPIPERHQAMHIAETARNSLAPNARTFAILLKHLPNIVGYGEVPKLWRHMETLGITPTGQTIAALMEAHIQVGNLSMAGRIAYDICRPKLSSDIQNAWRQLFNWPAEPNSIGFRHYSPDIQIFEALLHGVLENTGLRGVLLLIPAMHATNIEPTSRTVLLILKFVRQRMNVEVPGLSQLVNALASHTKQRGPSLHHLNELLLAAVEDNESKSQNIGWKSFYSRLISPKGNPEHITSDPSMTMTAGLVVSHAAGGEFNSVVDSLKDKGQTPDAFTYNLRLRYEAITKGDMAAAERVLADMLDRGIRPNVHHWLDLMRGCIRLGNMASAERIIDAMRYMKFEVDVRTYTVLMHGYAGIHEPEEAMRVFQTMLEHDIRPDWGAVDALAGAYYGAKQLDEARQVLLEYWSYVAPFPPELLHAPLSILIANFRAAQHKAQPVNIHSWDGGYVTDGKMSGPQRHSHAKDITKAVINSWTTVFGDKGNRSLLNYSESNPLGTVSRSVFFISKYRERVLRRLGKRIWLMRGEAIQAWERESGKKWAEQSSKDREALKLQACLMLHPAELRVFNSWDVVREGTFQFDHAIVSPSAFDEESKFTAPTELRLRAAD
ncbi:hypothetical protein DACRYDRAFT_68795 [Dacryopinax primogenitus]|uniref:Pentacotripeptide-repeat region of PRORP domain-containing protein n=1 Tax=Dacryopinax primogenitus (strain DJM 731) TaxID=1858805 RepID=M5G7Z4_DACPD|nr:uncharacterized protein DACRYDRAFT_68795 [Dacryopinax primogenitus]EJT99887.1 hypothetical protein DACRYDRAFT_68795 [Dacryopinax primogenitus]